jgi:hypothetical protein
MSARAIAQVMLELPLRECAAVHEGGTFTLPQPITRCSVCWRALRAIPEVRWPGSSAAQHDVCSFRCALVVFQQGKAA